MTLRLEGAWIAANLSDLSGLPAAYGDPVAYVCGDGINAIVCVGAAAIGSPIYKLWLGTSGWQWADIKAIAGAPTAVSGLSAYVRGDGVSTVNYTGYGGHVHEIRLEATWIWADLTAIASVPGTVYSPPRGYARGDGVNCVVYAGSDTSAGHLYELWLGDVWQPYELTSVPHAVPGYAPIGYVRADGISAVVYLGTDWHIHEIRLDSAWRAADLTSLSRATDAATAPWPYNRSAIVRVHLPLVLRSW
ncbi:MAG: hypothetical protein JXA93_03445 [Anaerolineae bacterium]|nr:hypothetical protein [Anaerolineae bacterium]